MITTERFSLSYDPFKWNFIVFKREIVSTRKHIVDTGVVNDVTRSRQSVITRTRVDVRFL